MNNSQETMDDMDVITFCKVFEVLTPFPDVVQRLDKWGSPYKSQKRMLLTGLPLRRQPAVELIHVRLETAVRVLVITAF